MKQSPAANNRPQTDTSHLWTVKMSTSSTSRPISQHRLSVSGPNALSVPTRNSFSRTHSHSTSNNPPNRIGRRKSSTFSKSALASLQDMASQSTVGSLPSLPHAHSAASVLSSSAVVDGPSLSSFQADDKKLKMRRASDGTHLSKKDKAASGELKCEHCGKAYKHGSCLTKHLWEHTPEWQYTSKLLISKHQQVQLLEAASVLVAMNQDGPNDSDNSSSPAGSGSSDMRDEELSSTETTPPPHLEHSYRDSKRFSNESSLFSRSYQSVFSESGPTAEHGFSHHRQWSTSSASRPVTAESYNGDEADLAAAVGLLSCSYGTPKTAPSALNADVPPVPPLPAKYQKSAYSNLRNNQADDVEMEGEDSFDDEPSHGRHEDVDDGMFGKMDA